MFDYAEIPDAFPDDPRRPVPEDCPECQHPLDAHDRDGICQIRGCDCDPGNQEGA